MSASFIRGGLGNVRTVVKSLDGSVLRTFPEKEILKALTIADWLSFAGFTLEEKQSITPDYMNGDPAAWPIMRQTGVVSAFGELGRVRSIIVTTLFCVRQSSPGCATRTGERGSCHRSRTRATPCLRSSVRNYPTRGAITSA